MNSVELMASEGTYSFLTSVQGWLGNSRTKRQVFVRESRTIPNVLYIGLRIKERPLTQTFIQFHIGPNELIHGINAQAWVCSSDLGYMNQPIDPPTIDTIVREIRRAATLQNRLHSRT